MTYTERHTFLLKFLLDNDALTQWIYNRTHIPLNGKFTELLDILGDNPSDAISMAFDWSHTVEGHQYWGELHRKWMSKFK